MKILAHLQNLADELREEGQDELADFIKRRAQDMQIIKFQKKQKLKKEIEPSSKSELPAP